MSRAVKTDYSKWDCEKCNSNSSYSFWRTTNERKGICLPKKDDCKQADCEGPTDMIRGGGATGDKQIKFCGTGENPTIEDKNWDSWDCEKCNANQFTLFCGVADKTEYPIGRCTPRTTVGNDLKCGEIEGDVPLPKCGTACKNSDAGQSATATTLICAIVSMTVGAPTCATQVIPQSGIGRQTRGVVPPAIRMSSISTAKRM